MYNLQSLLIVYLGFVEILLTHQAFELLRQGSLSEFVHLALHDVQLPYAHYQELGNHYDL